MQKNSEISNWEVVIYTQGGGDLLTRLPLLGLLSEPKMTFVLSDKFGVYWDLGQWLDLGLDDCLPDG